jgi:hypothetical protein
VIYLCSPYTHPDPAVREQRFEATCRAAADLIRMERPVYSPIVFSHPLCRYGLPLDWQFWQQHDLAFLAMCDEVIVLKLDGWEQSVGIQAEIVAAKALGKPVSFIAPTDEADGNDETSLL